MDNKKWRRGATPRAGWGCPPDHHASSLSTVFRRASHWRVQTVDETVKVGRRKADNGANFHTGSIAYLLAHRPNRGRGNGTTNTRPRATCHCLSSAFSKPFFPRARRCTAGGVPVRNRTFGRDNTTLGWWLTTNKKTQDSSGRTADRGRRPHPTQYLRRVIAGSVKRYRGKIETKIQRAALLARRCDSRILLDSLRARTHEAIDQSVEKPTSRGQAKIGTANTQTFQPTHPTGIVFFFCNITSIPGMSAALRRNQRWG